MMKYTLRLMAVWALLVSSAFADPVLIETFDNTEFGQDTDQANLVQGPASFTSTPTLGCPTTYEIGFGSSVHVHEYYAPGHVLGDISYLVNFFGGAVSSSSMSTLIYTAVGETYHVSFDTKDISFNAFGNHTLSASVTDEVSGAVLGNSGVVTKGTTATFTFTAISQQTRLSFVGENCNNSFGCNNNSDIAFDNLVVTALGSTGPICELVVDADQDGVADDADFCPGTPTGEVVDSTGCSVAQTCGCDDDWRNHGQFVSCTARTVQDFVATGVLTQLEGDAVISNAAKSDCGKKKPAKSKKSKK